MAVQKKDSFEQNTRSAQYNLDFSLSIKNYGGGDPEAQPFPQDAAHHSVIHHSLRKEMTVL
jgi:hypothetical protein